MATSEDQEKQRLFDKLAKGYRQQRTGHMVDAQAVLGMTRMAFKDTGGWQFVDQVDSKLPHRLSELGEILIEAAGGGNVPVRAVNDAAMQVFDGLYSTLVTAVRNGNIKRLSRETRFGHLKLPKWFVDAHTPS